MVFGNEKKLEKCEFELVNDDPWTKTAKGISKTMQEAIKPNALPADETRGKNLQTEFIKI